MDRTRNKQKEGTRGGGVPEEWGWGGVPEARGWERLMSEAKGVCVGGGVGRAGCHRRRDAEWGESGWKRIGRGGRRMG